MASANVGSVFQSPFGLPSLTEAAAGAEFSWASAVDNAGRGRAEASLSIWQRQAPRRLTPRGLGSGSRSMRYLHSEGRPDRGATREPMFAEPEYAEHLSPARSAPMEHCQPPALTELLSAATSRIEAWISAQVSSDGWLGEVAGGGHDNTTARRGVGVERNGCACRSTRFIFRRGDSRSRHAAAASSRASSPHTTSKGRSRSTRRADRSARWSRKTVILARPYPPSPGRRLGSCRGRQFFDRIAVGAHRLTIPRVRHPPGTTAAGWRHIAPRPGTQSSIR